MFKSNFLTAIRHLIKNKGLSAINIFGLSVSIAICLLSYIFISYEYSHDNFHKKGDRIYQVINRVEFSGNDPYYNSLQNYKLADDLNRDIPQIENAVAFRTCGGWIKYGDKKFREDIAFTDSSFFNIFSFDFLINSETSLLKNEKDIYITQKLADKLINAKSLADYSKLIGKTIAFSDINDRPLIIAGILKNLPKNSSIKFDIILKYNHSRYYSQSNNFIGNSDIYVSLNNSVNKHNVEQVCTAQSKKLYSKAYSKLTDNENINGKLMNFTVELLPVKDKYFTDKLEWAAYSEKGNKQYSFILAYISLLALILACVNYIMLSIGISMKRFKEIAVKKVFGSKRMSIIVQFITEISLTILISLLVGIGMAEVSLPFFNNLLDYNLVFNVYNDIFAYLFLICLFIIIVAIISIPSIYISKQNPISIFRNQTKMGTRLGMAKSFIVIQFTLSLILIIASVFIVKQIEYMKTLDIGFDAKNVVTINIPSDFSHEKTMSLQNRYRKIASVKHVGGSDRNFIYGNSSTGFNIDKVKIHSRILRIDSSYINSLGITLLKGRNLRGTDNKDNSVIINEEFANRLSWKEPIGKMFSFWGRDVTVVGLVKDFHFDSMHSSISPLVCSSGSRINAINHLFVKVKEGKMSSALSEMKSIWREYDIERELSYSFLYEKLRGQYENEERMAKIISTITILALMISVFGLIGLTMLLLMQKIKEIGVRKINGASTSQILVIINKEFAKYLIIAAVIAIPVSYYGLSKWLETFAYKTALSWWIFILCLFSLGIVVVATISYKSIRAAMSNPVDAIKYE